MNRNSDGNNPGCASEECEVISYSLLPQSAGEVGLVEGAAQFGEDMLRDKEVKLAVQPGNKQLPGRTSCIRKAGGQDILLTLLTQKKF